jgi:hypothetical protein
MGTSGSNLTWASATSLPERISLNACAILATSVCYVAYGSVTQKVETQTEGDAVEQSPLPAPNEQEFILGER